MLRISATTAAAGSYTVKQGRETSPVEGQGVNILVFVIVQILLQLLSSAMAAQRQP